MQNKLPKNFLFVDKFNLNDLTFLNKNIDIIYRNYKQKASKNPLLSLKNFCKKDRRKLYLSNNIKLALSVKADGIYIPSFNKINKNQNLENKNLILLGSAHNQKEIHNKILQGCVGIFLAPLFKTNKQNR